MLERLSKQEISNLPDYANHEEVVKFTDSSTGLRGFIAIHNTSLGPAIGGTRMYPFESEQEALSDVLKLSSAMTNKCALAGLPYGGGKCVIIGDRMLKTPEFLRAYGRVIEAVGKIRTGVDVGISDADVEVMAEETDYMVGTAKHGVKLSTADMAALGVYYSIKACLLKVFGQESPLDRRIVIQGAGKLGGELVRLLSKDKAKILVSDIDPTAIIHLKLECPEIERIEIEEVLKAPCDLLAPCALGGEINPKTVEKVQAKIICGGANNQLSAPELAIILHQKGVLYAPDYIANAGGLINVADELEQGGYNKERVLARVAGIGQTLGRILEQALVENISPSLVADRMATNIIQTKIING